MMLAIAFVFCGTAHAQLAQGAQAPTFQAPAALAGQPFVFKLDQALAQGPAVVYFYPKAFTSGCTIEAQMFAQSMDEFKALNATVVGVSGDDLETLKKFSEGPCGGKFAVAADPDGKIIDKYDAGFAIIPGMADRISYAIAPDGTILEAFESMSPSQHVSKSLEAIRAWHDSQASTTK
jgi:peroxiredoxin